MKIHRLYSWIIYGAFLVALGMLGGWKCGLIGGTLMFYAAYDGWAIGRYGGK